MTAAPANGITIEYEEYGDPGDEPLLLVMGLGGQLVGWPIDFVERLVDRGFRVIRYDNRDIGLSTKIDAPPPKRRHLVTAILARRWARAEYLLTDMADDAVGLLDHLGIERAHIVGISMGGMISQTIAIEHPDRVASLTSIMSNTGDRKNGGVDRKLLRSFKMFVRPDPGNVENGLAVFRLISGPHFEEDRVREMVEEAIERHADVHGTARQTMAILASPDRTEGLHGVTAPTLVVHGLLDPLVKSSGGVATARAVPGSRLVMFPDMAHDLPFPRWTELIDEIIGNTRRSSATVAEPVTAAG